MPWDPTSTDDIDNEYQNKQLNELTHEYIKNKEHAEQLYGEDKDLKVQAAKKEAEMRKEAERKLNEPEGVEKINELRDMVDDKDRKLQKILKESKEPLNEDPLGYSDPWMERKTEEIPTEDTKIKEVTESIFE